MRPGSATATPIFHNIMNGQLKGIPAEAFGPYGARLLHEHSTYQITLALYRWHWVQDRSVGCDGITALDRGFNEAENPSIGARQFDLILATRNIRARYPIRWKHRNVKGHQDDNHSACSKSLELFLNLFPVAAS
jgi:hypothetical protein